MVSHSRPFLLQRFFDLQRLTQKQRDIVLQTIMRSHAIRAELRRRRAARQGTNVASDEWENFVPASRSRLIH